MLIVPMRSKGMPQWRLCVRSWDAERPWLHSHAERGNDREITICSINEHLVDYRIVWGFSAA
ncbi:hypothetical protein FPT12_22615 [Pseudomonas sp. H3(2019)]|nr:hypothetical protein FPT12_22615 [Pseudomonas sp. H3(2019)]